MPVSLNCEHARSYLRKNEAACSAPLAATRIRHALFEPAAKAAVIICPP